VEVTTSTNRTIFARMAAGLLATAAAMGLALASVPAAHASESKILVEVSGTRIMRISGTSIGDNAVATGGSSSGSGTQILVSSAVNQLTAGLGCIQVGAAVKCDNVSRIKFIGGAGDDTFRNDSGLPVQLEGGPGRDRLSGGPANDAIIGGADSDFAFGGPGTDTCSQSENESGCEL